MGKAQEGTQGRISYTIRPASPLLGSRPLAYSFSQSYAGGQNLRRTQAHEIVTCGRFSLPDGAAVSQILKIDRWNWHRPEPRYNVAPTTLVPLVIRADDVLLELNGARWGLIPHWWKKDAPPSLTFNALSEEAAEKPTWRHSMRKLRCLMPARGWYEWNEKEQVRSDSGRLVKQPYFISAPNAEAIAFAGLWSIRAGQDGTEVLSCALLSKAASPTIVHIHNRMPVVLKPDHFDA
ncbi:SOS response-associated peptidase [Desulfomicrobium sp. ZS1]|uniref:SOS response-associated peptidase n=1 Tax=Desulfomicrobium sp. ZS1 TaxID=2952228 RepID=UPI0020B1DEEE|nr:SOS response-associated peptidase [Desulfomicrobium sp. ZS1]UTF51829.1 SOS response-associated peptidase [Desulfomicrobium sp. ZS1]